MDSQQGDPSKICSLLQMQWAKDGSGRTTLRIDYRRSLPNLLGTARQMQRLGAVESKNHCDQCPSRSRPGHPELNDVGRLLGLIYFAASQPGDEMATDLRGRDFFIPEPTGAFFGF